MCLHYILKKRKIKGKETEVPETSSWVWLLKELECLLCAEGKAEPMEKVWSLKEGRIFQPSEPPEGEPGCPREE